MFFFVPIRWVKFIHFLKLYKLVTKVIWCNKSGPDNYTYTLLSVIYILITSFCHAGYVAHVSRHFFYEITSSASQSGVFYRKIYNYLQMWQLFFLHTVSKTTVFFTLCAAPCIYIFWLFVQKVILNIQNRLVHPTPMLNAV